MLLFKKYYSPMLLQFFVAAWVFCSSLTSVNAQFAPPVGQNGTTAIKKDSSIFVAWANFCESQRGYVDISKPDLGFTTYGTDSVAIGIANNNVLSLGDAGSALLKFELAIVDGSGYDFAVF